MVQKKPFFIIVSMLMLFVSIGIHYAGTIEAGHVRTAYKIDVMHFTFPPGCSWDWCREAHYGAYFGGAYGIKGTAYFTGASGAYSGYSDNDWAGTYRTQMGISKTWLYTPLCWNHWLGSFNICLDRWTNNYHHAELLY